MTDEDISEEARIAESLTQYEAYCVRWMPQRLDGHIGNLGLKVGKSEFEQIGVNGWARLEDRGLVKVTTTGDGPFLVEITEAGSSVQRILNAKRVLRAHGYSVTLGSAS